MWSRSTKRIIATSNSFVVGKKFCTHESRILISFATAHELNFAAPSRRATSLAAKREWPGTAAYLSLDPP